MYNLQANGLSQAILRSHNPKLHLLSFEPLMIKKSELKALEIGDSIVLGKKLPQLYIYRKDGIVGQAQLGRAMGRESVVISAKERIDNLGKAEPKYTLLETRIATLPKSDFEVGKLVELPVESLSSILLFSRQKLVAMASLIQAGGNYALQIQKRYI